LTAVGEDDAENELEYGIYGMVMAGRALHLIVELQRHSTLRGPEEGQSAFDFAAGFRAYPGGLDNMSLALGFRMPLYNSDFDRQMMLSLAYHLD
jgi:hypothetical protein